MRTAEEEKTALEWFTKEMSNKLQGNRHKGSWSGEELSWLLYRLKEEVEELAVEVLKHPDPIYIIEEAADVANFAMMIACNARPGEMPTRGGIDNPLSVTEANICAHEFRKSPSKNKNESDGVICVTCGLFLDLEDLIQAREAN